jgi:nucleotide-binding universal stress UspA family protein
VAWNAGREAVRAVNDALPILQAAESVSVLAVDPPSGKRGEGPIPSADICHHLARHGVHAEAASSVVKDIEIGSFLLSHAADRGVDMIVMGAYGHSRLSEMMLGGVTRSMLQHMTVPVFMSH